MNNLIIKISSGNFQRFTSLKPYLKPITSLNPYVKLEFISAAESAAKSEVDINQPTVNVQSDDDIASNEEANIDESINDDIKPGPSGLNSKPKNDEK